MLGLLLAVRHAEASAEPQAEYLVSPPLHALGLEGTGGGCGSLAC